MNDRQKQFCKEYIIDLNSSAAAVRAGYSEKTARQMGSKLLTKANIQEYMQKLMDRRAKKVQISAENVLEDILDTRDTCKNMMTITGDHGGKLFGAALSGRNKANELLGKHLKLFTDKIELEVKEMPKIIIE